MSTSSVVVFDASAVVTWTLRRDGFQDIETLLGREDVKVLLHKQNATEFWYQMHRRSATKKFLLAHPERVQADGRADLTGLDFDDPTVFDATAGRGFADEQVTRIEAAGVNIVGDEQSPDLWKRAAELKSKFRRVSLADCFGVALSVELNTPFWTSDRHELTALDAAGVGRIHFIR